MSTTAELLAALHTAEEALGNNLVGLSDLLDLQIRQGHKEAITRLAELNAGWVAVCKAIAKAEGNG